MKNIFIIASLLVYSSLFSSNLEQSKLEPCSSLYRELDVTILGHHWHGYLFNFFDHDNINGKMVLSNIAGTFWSGFAIPDVNEDVSGKKNDYWQCVY